MPNGATVATTVLPRENCASPFAPDSGLTQSTGSPVRGADAHTHEPTVHMEMRRKVNFTRFDSARTWLGDAELDTEASPFLFELANGGRSSLATTLVRLSAKDRRFTDCGLPDGRLTFNALPASFNRK
jgi:hypothetical protein